MNLVLLISIDWLLMYFILFIITVLYAEDFFWIRIVYEWRKDAAFPKPSQNVDCIDFFLHTDLNRSYFQEKFRIILRSLSSIPKFFKASIIFSCFIVSNAFWLTIFFTFCKLKKTEDLQIFYRSNSRSIEEFFMEWATLLRVSKAHCRTTHGSKMKSTAPLLEKGN